MILSTWNFLTDRQKCLQIIKWTEEKYSPPLNIKQSIQFMLDLSQERSADVKIQRAKQKKDGGGTTTPQKILARKEDIAETWIKDVEDYVKKYT